MKFYAPVFHPDGRPLQESHDPWKYWNAACWHRSVPADCTGLTYLDIGCQEGYYAMRFAQRGGRATGLNFGPDGNIITHATADMLDPAAGELDWDRVRELHRLYPGPFQVRAGGFSATGTIIPDPGPTDIISCFNVLEYMMDPAACLAALFDDRHAAQRVLLATDILHARDGHGGRLQDPQRHCFELPWLQSQIPWPFHAWLYDMPHNDKICPQIFITATHPRATLPTLDSAPIIFDTDCTITETQRHYLASLRQD